MANCPKCNHKLKITDISQFCPECGVNMRFWNFEENFIREAKTAELSQAVIHVKVRRLKASLIGSKLAIVRLCVILLPLLSLLIPAASFSAAMPFRDMNVSMGGIGIYTMFTNGDFDFMNRMCASAFLGEQFSAMRVALFSYAAVALFVIAVIVSTILCFVSYKKMQKVIAGISFAGAAFCAVNAVLTGMAVKKFTGEVLSSSFGVGIFVAAAMFIVVAAVNLILHKKGIEVDYAEGMVERVEIWQKVKAGQVTIDELPQPVVETEETRKIDEEIAKEEENFRKNHAEKTADAEGGEDK